MKKLLKSGLCLGITALMSVAFITGCGGGGEIVTPGGDDDTTTTKTYNTETRAFTMAIGAIDGNFNPFFYTAQNDGTVASMTQVSMLSTDAGGNAVCGEDMPTVAKDYTITEAADGSETTYRFLIKNGMKFSDGVDLTVMDVLFSMYVNLDIAYTGSATMYSTDIQGLNAYRAQDSSLSDDSTQDYTSTFTSQGRTRINNIIAALNGEGTKTAQVLADIETVKELFREELESDWTTIESSFSSSYTESTFEYNFGEGEAWKYYYLNEGIISVLTYTNSSGATVQLKDDNGKYLTTLDYHATYNTNPPDYEEEMEAAASDESLIKVYTDNGATREDAIEYVKRDTAIRTVYDAYTSTDSGIVNILSYWGTSSTALEKFAGEARTEYYENLKEQNGGNLSVETIKGITVERVSQWTDSDGNTVSLGEEYDVLQIVINDIDPKAIWNFSFTVCPMHYYSDEEHTEAAMADYQTYLTTKDGSVITHFGVELGNSTFFDEVLQDGDKNLNPVGAGAYKTSNINGGDGTASTFYTNKYVYYQRNDYFNTMGDGIENAIIKYVQYREMGDDQILSALATGLVDYGTPSATADNQTELAKYSTFLNASTLYDTSGYGYVGINPKYVPEHQVRQAIMKAMNTSSIVSNYYTRQYASVIYRPMSKTSWVYDYYTFTEYESIAYTTQTKEIIALVEEAGYTNIVNGVRYNSDGDSLKFTFTIAGESTDHPAYQMFLAAETLLEQCGFDITVAPDINALKKLATGDLAVWAAAWTSAIDPDMYQVYHKDSTATSVKNWNYTNILQSPSEWSYEYEIIQELSDVIDLARTVNDHETRAGYYAQALDLVMDLAVELPTYQRKDNEVFNYTIIDRNSLTETPSTYVSLIDRIWEIDYL